MNFVKKNYKMLLSIVFVSLFLYLVYYILFASRSLLNSDSAFFVDYSLEVLKYKQIFPRTWVNTNDFWIYSLIPFITIFIKCGINFYFSRQLAVLVQTIIFFIILYDFMKNVLNLKKEFFIFVFIIITGISSQFMFEVFSDASYGTIILFMLLSLSSFCKFLQKGKKIYILFFSLLITVLTSLSMRFPIYITAPLICTTLFLTYKNGVKKKYIILLGVMVGSTLVGFILNKVLINHLIISQKFSKNLITNSQESSENFSTILFNYLWISGATNINLYSLSTFIFNDFIKSDSPIVVLVFIKFIYAICTLVIPAILIKKINKLPEKLQIVLIYTISLSIILFFFLYVCQLCSWYRYLTPVIFFLNILYAIIYNQFISKTLKDKIVFFIYLILIGIASLFMVFNSYYDIKNNTKRINPSYDLIEFLESKNLNFGYKYYGGEHNIYNTLSNGKIRITILDKNGQPYYWLNSLDWFTIGYTKGNVFFIRKENDNHLDFENEAIKTYSYKDYKIFVFEGMKNFTSRFDYSIK